MPGREPASSAGLTENPSDHIDIYRFDVGVVLSVLSRLFLHPGGVLSLHV